MDSKIIKLMKKAIDKEQKKYDEAIGANKIEISFVLIKMKADFFDLTKIRY